MLKCISPDVLEDIFVKASQRTKNETKQSRRTSEKKKKTLSGCESNRNPQRATHSKHRRNRGPH